MGFLSGIWCHVEALQLLRGNRILLFLSGLRFIVLLTLFVFLSALALSYNTDLMSALWARPTAWYILILWQATLAILTLILLMAGAVLSYLISQVLFGVLIADYMSAVTERLISGKEESKTKGFAMRYLFFLIGQEIPRAIIPAILSVLVMIFGWFLPLGILWACFSSLVGSVFLAWDYTDLTPARRLCSFKERFRFLKSNIMGHIGLGLPLLIPILNILFFSIGPISGTIYFLKKARGK